MASQLEVVVFPSDGVEEVTAITLGGESTLDRTIPVAKFRIDSETDEVGLSFVKEVTSAELNLLPMRGMVANVGNPSSLSISAEFRKQFWNFSIRNTRTTLRNNPPTSASTITKRFFGYDGDTGVDAFEIILASACWRSC